MCADSFQVHLDSFEDNTILGSKQFTNIIATYPAEPVENYLVLSAHYDSKLFKVRAQSCRDELTTPSGLCFRRGHGLCSAVRHAARHCATPRCDGHLEAGM